MRKILGTMKQAIMDFYKQLPNKLQTLKVKIDELKPSAIKESRVEKDSASITFAFIGSISGLVFGILIGINLFTYKFLIFELTFIAVMSTIGLLKKHYQKKVDSRKIELLDTLIFTQLVSVPVITILAISQLF